MKGGNLNLEQANHDATKVSVIGEMNHRILLYQNKGQVQNVGVN